MKLLLFDTVLDGHHTDYLTHLIEYWHTQQVKGELCVVTPKGLAAQFPSKITLSSQIKFIELTEPEVAGVRDASMIGRSFTAWNLYVKYAEKFHPDHALLMYFDVFQLGLWLGRKSPCPVSGIYFRPNFYQKINANWKDKMVLFRKKLILSRALAKPNFAALFCLDKSAVTAIKSIAKRSIVLPLSDPVKYYDLTSDQVERQKQQLGIEKSRIVLLLFGYLDDRKGSEPILDAIAMLSQEESKRLTLLLAGPIGEEFRQLVEAKIAALDNDAQIICHFETLKGSNIQTFFALSDFVLTLYRKHVGMSSIVVRAALSQKPLLSSNFGYLGNLVESQGLGITLDSESPVAICEAFRQALRGEINFNRRGAEKLTEENTARVFAEQILAGINGHS